MIFLENRNWSTEVAEKGMHEPKNQKIKVPMFGD